MANELRATTVSGGGFFRDAFLSHGIEVEDDTLIGFGNFCDECGVFFEAETTAAFLEQHGYLCDGHRCANRPSR